jgi:hypothetical protein
MINFVIDYLSRLRVLMKRLTLRKTLDVIGMGVIQEMIVLVVVTDGTDLGVVMVLIWKK